MRALLVLLAVAAVAVPLAAGSSWHRATATAYSTTENLTGCSSPGRCSMACGGYLDDRKLTVASNPRLGLPCGARIVVCRPAPRLCARATVTDRTLSRFSFEFSRRLAWLTGQRGAAWDSPRTVLWQRLP